MKKSLFTFLVVVLSILALLVFTKPFSKEITKNTLKEQHQFYLDNSPFKKTQHLTKAERKSLGLPPNAYNERMWELTLDPRTGRPMPERVLELQKTLKSQRIAFKGVGGDGNNVWVDRGPNDIGGRTRGIMFDPNDTGNANAADDYTRVFAGGVSGGLWVNNDITNANSSWTLVSGIGANISVNIIISDPNDPDIFYIGAGESYTTGAALGRGIWQSLDGGVTWSNIFGDSTDTTSNGANFIDGVFYINDIVARDNMGSTEVYASVAGASYSSSGTLNQFHGLIEMGLYKSTNDGVSWNRFNITYPDDANDFNWENTYKNPNDIELDKDNHIWFTTSSNSFGGPGGDIYESTNGTTFTLMHTISGADRTEIEPSIVSAGTLWVLANVGGEADLFTTTNSFTSTSPMTTEPNDADLGISATDFTRNQAFYDLVIEADASDNLVVGGVDLFRSTDNGTTWSQISKWSNNANLNTLTTISTVHADQHAMIFRPGTGNDNKVVFGTDGGVYYSDDITMATSSTTNITSRNKDYNTVQFYYGDISSVINGGADDLIGGTQDNGTPAVYDAGAGANGFTDITGGDGGYTEIDDAGNYIITAFPRNTHYVLVPPSTVYEISNPGPIDTGDVNTENTENGSFINEAALDKNLDILYSNATFRTLDASTKATISTTYQLERTSNLTNGEMNVVNHYITDALLTASPTAFKVSPHTGASTKLLVGLENGTLLQIDDANVNMSESWSDITGGSFVGSISDVEFGVDDTEIFVTMSNYGVTSLWFTTDSGTTWSSKEGDLPDLPVKCILQNPLLPNELIVGTELGVWATANYTVANPTWVQSFNGMSDVTVLDLDVRASDNVILATTHGRGLFTSLFTSTPLSVAENSIANSTIKIFPTVSNGDFTIVSKIALGDVDLEVFSISGKSVFKSKINILNNSTSNQLNLTGLSSGLYLVRIVKDDFREVDKIIIK